MEKPDAQKRAGLYPTDPQGTKSTKEPLHRLIDSGTKESVELRKASRRPYQVRLDLFLELERAPHHLDRACGDEMARRLLFVLSRCAFFRRGGDGSHGRRQRWKMPIDLHIVGMGVSYIAMLTAFYVDNGKSLPIWRDPPPITYWLLPSAVGVPLIVWALARYQNVIAYAGALPASGLATQTKTDYSRRRPGTLVSSEDP
jgi:hypothetical protein